MKKLTVMLAAVLSLAIVSESIYGKSGEGKSGDRGKSEKSDRDNNRGGNGKSERGGSISSESEGHSKVKNQKALDAQRNWGQLKKELKDEDGNYKEEELRKFFGSFYDEETDYTDKDIKNAIKAEKVVRRELRRNEESLPDEANLERIVNNYLYGETQKVEYYLRGLEGFDEKSLDRMGRAKEKYDATLDNEDENDEVAVNSGE